SKQQLMCLHLLDSFRREWQRKCKALIPGLPLVHVIGAEGIAGLSSNCVERRSVKIGEVNCEAPRLPESASDLLYGVAGTRLRMEAGTGPTPDEWDLAEHGVVDVDGRMLAPTPFAQVFRRFRVGDGSFDGSGEKSIVAFVFFWQPTLRLLSENVLQ